MRCILGVVLVALFNCVLLLVVCFDWLLVGCVCLFSVVVMVYGGLLLFGSVF